MDIPSRIGRAVWLAIAGVGLALAWALIAIVFGGGAAAHAAGADDDAPGFGLSTLIGVVDDAAHGLTGSAGEVTEGAARASTDADIPVTMTAPVVSPTAPKASTVVAHARTDIQRALGAIGSRASTTPILRAGAEVVDPVAQTPVVSRLVAPLHLMTALASATSAVDGVLSVAGGAIDDAVTPITATAPDAPLQLLVPLAPDTAGPPASTGPSWATLQAWWSATASAGAHFVTTAAVATVTAASAAPMTLSALFSPPGVSAAVGSSSSGPAGAGSGAAALLTAGLLFAHRAWVRRGRPGDDLSPAAPVYATDVSPD